jgi:hypothetical protein
LKVGQNLRPVIRLIAGYVETMAEELRRIYDSVDDPVVWEDVNSLADSIGGGVTFFGDVLDVLEKLNGFRTPRNADTVIATVANYIDKMVKELKRVAGLSKPEDWEKVKEFADELEGAIGFIGTALDVVEKVRSFRQISRFGKIIETIANYIGKMALELQRVRNWRESIDAWDGIKEFTERVQESVALFGTAIDTIEKVRDFRAMPGRFGKIIETIANYIGKMSVELLRIRNWRKDMQAWQDVKEFATAVGEGISLFADAIETIVAIGEFKQPKRFEAQLGEVITNINTMLRQLFAFYHSITAAEVSADPTLTMDQIRNLKDFVDLIGPIVDIFNDVTDVVTAVGKLKPITDFEAKIMSLTGYMSVMMRAMRSLQMSMTGKAVHAKNRQTQNTNWEAVEEFSNTIRGIFSAFSDAVKAIDSIAGFKAVKDFDSKLDLLISYMDSIMRRMRLLATGKAVHRAGDDPKTVEEQWGPTGEFMAILKAVMDGVKSATDTLALFTSQWKPISEQAMDDFIADLKTFMNKLKEKLADLAADEFDDLKELTGTFSGIGSGIRGMVDALTSISDYKRPSTAKINDLFADIRKVIEFVRLLAQDLQKQSDTALDDITAGSKALGELATGLAVVEALLKLGVYRPIEGVNLYGHKTKRLEAFKEDLKAVIAAIFEVSDWVKNTYGEAEAKTKISFVADVIGAVADSMNTALELITKLWSYVDDIQHIIPTVRNGIGKLLEEFASLGAIYAPDTDKGKAIMGLAAIIDAVANALGQVYSVITDWEGNYTAAGFGLGVAIGEGIAGGIISTIPLIEGSLVRALEPAGNADRLIAAVPSGNTINAPSNVNINFTGPVRMDSKTDIDRLADAVSQRIGANTRRIQKFVR